MTIASRVSPMVLPVLVAAAVLLPASTAFAADTVVPNNQIVQGAQCVGVTCASGESFAGNVPQFMVKSVDTPGMRLMQAGGSYGAQTWDVSGNEANFFIRDITRGSTLPFRIRPGAPTSAVDIGADGNVLNMGLVQQNAAGMDTPVAADGDDLLTKLASVPVNTYTYAGATHIAPNPASFFSTFTIGSANNVLAPQDVAGVALAGVKALDAKLATIQLTPGPVGAAGATGATGVQGTAGATGAQGVTGAAGSKGDAGAAGTAGTAGATGAQGAASPADEAARLKSRVNKLESRNAKLSKSVTSLQKQIAAIKKLVAKR